MAQPVSVVLTTPPPPSLQEATRNSTQAWQTHLESLFHHAKDRFPDVVWEFVADAADEHDQDDYGLSSVMAKHGSGPATGVIEEVWGHKAIVYARAPPSFQSRYFRPVGGDPSPLPYPAESSLSLGYADPSASTPALGALVPRTPSPFGRAASPTITLATSHAGNGQTSPNLLRLTTSINPTLFANELEYLYTGKGFGEAFEFLFDSSEAREHGLLTNGSGGSASEVDEAEALRIDKLRKDLVFMWRSRLYSDVRLALTGNFGGSHESTTAIFSSHRFILVSRCSYFHTALVAWPSNKNASANGEPPTLTLPSPPFTPASLHFTLGFIYTGTLVFSHRSYDLSTAFAILRAALYLALPSLQDEIQARIAQEMCHGLFHAFLTFSEYESITGGRWGTGGCRCRQCARRVPRVLEFALAEDVRNPHLERGARRALVGLFGEGWCNVEFASLPQKIRDSVVRGVGKRTTPLNAFALLWVAEHALGKLEANIDVWKETVKEMILTVRQGVDECLSKEAEQCFESEDWMEIVDSEGARFEDGERVEWAMRAVMRGVKEGWAALLYQTLVSSILLRPHPTETNAPQLSATSHIHVQVEQTRLELLKWIGKRWLAIRQERGFDALEGWAIKEISDHIEVPINDLLNPPAYSSPKTQPLSSSPGKRAPGTGQRSTPSALLLRPISSHPHTSKVDPESDVASSMRVSVLSRRLPTRSVASSFRERDRQSSASSVRSIARSTTESVASNSTVSATPRRRPAAGAASEQGMSPAKRLASEVRAGRGSAVMNKDEDHDRPDSKLTPSASYVSLDTASSLGPSIIEPSGDDRYSLSEEGGYADGEEGYGEDVTDEGYQEEMDGADAETKEGDLASGEKQSEHGCRDAEDDVPEDSQDEDGQTESDLYENARQELDPTSPRSSVASSRLQKGKAAENDTTPVKKTLVTRSSLASVQSKKGVLPSSISPTNAGAEAAKLRSSLKATNTLRKNTATTSPVRSPGTNPAAPRPSSRGSTRSTATSRLNVSVTGSGARAKPISKPISRPTSRLSTTSTTNRPVSTVSSATGSAATFRTASTGGALAKPTPTRSRRTSAASTASVRTAGPPSPVNERSRKISSTSVSSVASARSTAASTKTTPRVVKKSVSAGAADPNKRSPAAAIAASASTGKVPSSSSTRTGAGSTSLSSSTKKLVPVVSPSKKPLAPKKSTESLTIPPTPPSKTVSVVGDPPLEPESEVKDVAKGAKPKNDAEKENVIPLQPPLPDVPEGQQVNDASLANTSSTMTIKARPRADILPNEHKKTSSSASSSSVATVTKRGSTDTIRTVKSGAASSVTLSSASGESGKQNKLQPPPPQEKPSPSVSARAPLAPHPYHQASSSTLSTQPSSIEQVLADYVPQGATLEIGIPCIISSKRKRFKAYARYIGEVRGETGPWVGVEVPMPIGGDTWGDRDLEGSMGSSGGRRDDDRQWNDGSWGGIRYFEIGSAGSEADYGEDRASRRRRIDAGSVGGAVWGRGESKGLLKREGDQLSIASERMKRMRSVSPAVSEMSGTESRGLFVRPQQVLYVMDAVDSDL